MLIESKEEFIEYRYTFETITLSIKGDNEPIVIEPKFIDSLCIINDYSNLIGSLLTISFNIIKSDFLKIQKKIDDCSIEIVMSKHKHVEDDVIKFKTPFMKHVFDCISETELDLNVLTNLGINIEKPLEENQLSSGSDLSPMTLYLIDRSAIQRFREQSSISINGTMTDALYSILNCRGYKDVLLSPTKMSSKTQIVAPMGDLDDTLEFINNTYGIYEYPYMFFDGIDREYLLNIKEVGTVLDGKSLEHGTVLLLLEEKLSPESVINGCLVDEINKRYVINISVAPDITRNTNLNYSNWNKLYSLVVGEPSATINSNKPNTINIVKTRRLNNLNLVSQNEFMNNLNKYALNIMFTNIDVSIITPNKMYKVRAHQDYHELMMDGDYILRSQTSIFERMDEDQLKCRVKCTFSKIQ